MNPASLLDTTSDSAPFAPQTGWLPRVIEKLRSPAFRHSALSVADQAVVSGASFAGSVLVGRFCSPDELGVYALAFSVLLLARAIQGDVVSGPYLIYCHRRQSAALARYTGSSLIHQAVMSVLSLLAIGGLVVGIAHSGGSPGLISALVSLMVAVPFVLLREHLRQMSFAHLRLTEVLWLDVFVAAIQLGVIGWLASKGLLSVPAVYVAMAVGCGLAALAWWITRPDAVSFGAVDAWADWCSNWQFGRWALASQLVSRAMSYLAPWLIAWTHGEAATGLLAACVTVVNLAGMFVTGVSNCLTPRAARAYADGGATALRSVLHESVILFLVTIGGFCLAVGLSGDLLITLVYGDRFAGTSFVLLFLALQMLANSLGIVMGNGLWAVDRPRANFLADVATMTTTAAAMAVAVPTWGVTGAAFGLLMGTAVGAITRTWILLGVMRQRALATDDQLQGETSS
ncbi:MAG: hypothetical protein B7Z55_07115 [Planctomycetales bacterium 12-60-4]|nr:MAG: hypothetical protein B7Z55_07115 [Planctomycetales bacterium 12-60-4]